MIKKRIAYYYDPETCTYQKAGFSLSVFIRKGLFYAVFLLALAGISWIGYQEFFYQYKLEKHQEKADQLNAELRSLGENLAIYETQLDHIHKRDNDLYRPILNAGQIQSSVWEGGRGGADKYSIKNKDIATQLEIKIEEILHQINIQNKSHDELSVLADENEEFLKMLPSILPVDGDLVSGFGGRMHPFSGFYHVHTGLDFRCPQGTPIYATGDGVVEYAGANGNGYGIHIDVDHGNGFKTKYAHLSKLQVKEGEKVTRGQVIGLSGNTGMSTGPHLHYEIIRNSIKIDPLDFYYDDLPPEKYLRLLSNDQE